jgi:hypothetical protein
MSNDMEIAIYAHARLFELVDSVRESVLDVVHVIRSDTEVHDF